MLRPHKLVVLMITIFLVFFTLQGLLAAFPDESPSIVGWSPVAPLPERLVGGRALMIADKIYVVGGKHEPWSSAAVVSAQIDADDTISQWEKIYASNLPVPLTLHAMATTANAAYVIGGWDEVNRYSKVWKSIFTTTPALQTWEEVRNYPKKIVLHSAVYADNGYIYVLGGVDENNKPLDQVFFSKVTGTDLGAWTETHRLPNFRFRFTTSAHNKDGANYIYLLGGYDGEHAQREVYYGPIGEDGHIQKWEKTTPLPMELYYHEAFIHDNRLFVLGGRNDSDFSDKVYSAKFEADGKIGQWDSEAHLPISIHRFAIAVNTPSASAPWRVFVIGGLHNDLAQSQVYRSTPAPTATNTPVPPTPTNTPVPPTATHTPTHTSTPTVTPTATPGLAALGLTNQPDSALAPGDVLTYTIDFRNGPTTIMDYTLSNQISSEVKLVPGTIRSVPPMATSYSQGPNGNVIRWSAEGLLLSEQAGRVSYQVQRPTLTPMPSATPIPNAITIVKSGPVTAQQGELILYTLTVFNHRETTLTNLTIFDQIPKDAQYITGGTRKDDFVEWHVPLLDSGMVISHTYAVTSQQTITNSVYGIISNSEFIPGSQPVVTYINEETLPSELAVTVINQGAEATWSYNGQPDSMRSNLAFNPVKKSYLPLIMR